MPVRIHALDHLVINVTDVARTRIGWAMALFFGLQSLQAYSIFGWFAQLWRDNGYSAGDAQSTAHEGAHEPKRQHRLAAARTKRRDDETAAQLGAPDGSRKRRRYSGL